ncbi:MAG: TFIIB-type zinc ribbon-containing protein [Thermofilum sp.]
MSEVVCPECGYRGVLVLHEDTGEYVCPQCGYVFPEPTFERSPPLARDIEKGRIHYAVSRGTSTTPPSVSKQYARGSYKLETTTRGQRRSSSVLRLLSSLKVPKHIAEEVLQLVEKAARGGLLRGRSTRIVVAALLLYEMKRNPNLQVATEDIEKLARAEMKKVYKCYRLLLSSGIIQEAQSARPRKPSHVVASLAGKAGLREIFAQQNIPIRVVAHFADEVAVKLQGRKPAGIAAAVMYLVFKMMNIKKTQVELARLAGVSPLTLRRLSRQIPEQLEIIIKV